MGTVVAIATGAAAVLVWLGSVMLQQDRIERLERAADRVVQVFERHIAEAEAHLAALVASASDGPDDVGEFTGPVPDSGLTVLFAAETVQPFPASGLLFYPSLPVRPEPPPDLFRSGEAAEYRAPDQAARTFRRLAESPDATIRAAALMRLGRVLQRSGQDEAALAAYADMATLGDVPVIGLPADLVARGARAELLDKIGRRDEARREAGALMDDLTGGRWALRQGQYEYYADHFSALAGISDLPAGTMAVTRAVSDLWNQWQTQPPPLGRRLVRVDAVRLLLVSHGTQERLAAWIVDPAELAARLTEELGITVTLSDTDGVIVGDDIRQGQWALRTPADTRLPWTVHVDQALPAAGGPGITQRQLVIAGVGILLAFLVAGTYFIGRAIKREVDLSRLQADFVSAVSHEFRTPLAAMRQLSELLAAGRVTRQEKQQQYYESLAGESRRLQRLVESLLDFGRLEAGARPFQLEPLDPRALVEQVVSDFRSEVTDSGAAIDVEAGNDAAPLMGDRDALSLALHNLIDNAIKYSGGGRPVHVGWSREGKHVALSVRDEGPGLSADDRRRIFGKFVRGSAATHTRGSGIGLAIVQQVVRGLGGEVRVESEPGAGATFTLLLPAAEVS